MMMIDETTGEVREIKSPSGAVVAAADTDLTLTTNVEIMTSESCCVRPVPSESEGEITFSY
jgi:hypothetical protein